MAAPDTAPARFLKDQGTGGAGTTRDLALKIFSGTVFEAFTAKTAFFDNTGNIMATRVLTGQGHEAQFPIMGTEPAASYHNPGTLLVDGDIKMTEQTVRVDDILVAHVDVPFADLDIAHFDVLQPFATRLGRSLAINLDKKLAVVGVKAARHAAEAGIHAGGKQVTRDDGVTGTVETAASIAAAYPNSSTGSGRFRDDVAELAQKFDEDNVPEDGRYLFVSPYIRTIMRHEASSWGAAGNSTTLLPGPAGNIFDPSLSSSSGDLNRRVIGMLEGFNLIVTNHLPTADTSYTDAAGAAITKYNGKFDGLDDDNDGDGEGGYNASQAIANAKPAALALCGASEGAAAMGMVQAAGIRSVMEDDERRNTTFLKSQIMVGADILCPWTAGYIGVYT
tara:strand:+ start:4193 stop:5368 length:1176 start_codon:yes stop_codon:yes gene_type:complete